MSWSRYFFGLALLSLALLVFEYLTNPIPSAFGYGAAAGKALGGVFWGSIIWGVIRLIRGSDRSPDIRKFTLYAAFILVVPFITLRLLTGASLSQADRTSFSAGAEKTCISTMQQSADGTNLDSVKLQEFCSCYSSALANRITPEEFRYVAKNKTPSVSFQETISEVSRQCGQQINQIAAQAKASGSDGLPVEDFKSDEAENVYEEAMTQLETMRPAISKHIKNSASDDFQSIPKECLVNHKCSEQELITFTAVLVKTTNELINLPTSNDDGTTTLKLEANKTAMVYDVDVGMLSTDPEWRWSITPESIELMTDVYCGTPQTRNILNYGITMRYEYFYSDGVFIDAVNFTESMC